jgi:hypothetical protein
MLSYFPTFYPDEDSRSIIFRYHVHSGNSDLSATNSDLFGRKAYRLTVFPRNMNFLFNQLPSGFLSLDDFLFNHTYFHWVKPFIPSDRLAMVVREITENVGETNIAALLGRGQDWLISEDLRYCPKCMINDKEKYGEVYLHRAHQLAFLKCCPDHRSKLIMACPSCSKKLASAKDGKLLSSIECDCGCDLSHYQEEAAAPNFDIEQRIFKNFYQAVSYSQQVSREEIFITMKNALVLKGYLKYSGGVDRKQLFQHFEDFLKDNGLKEYLSTDIKNQVNSDSFFLSSKAVKNILFYILFMMFLSGSVENFISEKAAFSIPIPFRNGPWICNNPVCEGYGLGVIKKCVRVDHDGKYISGLFGCPICGFSFSRRWKIGEHGNEKPYSVLTMGPLWHSTVFDLHSSGLSNSAIAKRLKTSPTQIKLALNRLKEPPSDTRIAQSLEMLWGSSIDSNSEVSAASECSPFLTKNREKMLAVLKENSGLSRTELAKKYNHLFHKMLKNDRDWMEEHLPPSKKNHIRKNWAKLDIDYSKILAEAADDLYRSNPAEQIKKYTILAQSPKIITEHLENAPEKFPRATELLKCKVESFENYLVRHLPVIIEQMKKYNKRVITLDSIKTFSPMYRKSTEEVGERIISQLEVLSF